MPVQLVNSVAMCTNQLFAWADLLVKLEVIHWSRLDNKLLVAFSSKPRQETQTYGAGCVWVFWSATLHFKGYFGFLPGHLHWGNDSLTKDGGRKRQQWGESSKFPVVWWDQGLMAFFAFFLFCLFVFSYRTPAARDLPSARISGWSQWHQKFLWER